jgi:predicted RNA binding protein YcfA (HicA-like mRNA interferase family)
MGRPTPGLSSRQFATILRRNGCVLLRQSGGHAIWRTPMGARLVTVAEGRPTNPTFKEIKMAANALGLGTEELVRG